MESSALDSVALVVDWLAIEIAPDPEFDKGSLFTVASANSFGAFRKSSTAA
jgi:hypothetical protein